MPSPYENKNIEKWIPITKSLVDKHPFDQEEIKNVVLESWEQIFRSKIGDKPSFIIGKDIFPKPQIMGFLLHELISLALETKYPKEWRKEECSKDKDLVNLRDDILSVEIKTSSSPKNIFGNRSYAQKTEGNKKSKSGYYLAVNFEKFKNKKDKPKILKIRFGWIDHEDWVGQKSATGQQARLTPDVESKKLIELYSVK